MEGIFQTQGITESVPSDNGTPFSSAEFEGCLVYLGPAHPKRIPYWPQSNGEVERCNKTLLKEGKDRKKARAVRQPTVLKLGTSAIQSGGKKGNAVLIEDQGGNTKLRNASQMKKVFQPDPWIEATEADGRKEAEDSWKQLLWYRQPILINTLPYLLNQVLVPFTQGQLVLGAIEHGRVTLCPFVLYLLKTPKCWSM